MRNVDDWTRLVAGVVVVGGGSVVLDEPPTEDPNPELLALPELLCVGPDDAP